jgi:hypothetical protein
MSEWVAFADRHPPKNTIVLIAESGTSDVALADYCGVFINGPHLNGAGFSGYEWDWEFNPTHWKLFSTDLPA